MPARVTKEAPDFTAKAVVNGEIKDIKLSDYRGKKYVVLFFYPLNFTFVCPTEIIAFSDEIAKFEERGVQVLGVSVDSEYSHLAWINLPRNVGGLGELKYPLIADVSKKIASDYGVLLDDNSVALRGLFLIDKDGILPAHADQQHAAWPLDRRSDPVDRRPQVLRGERRGLPRNWKPGSATIKPTVDGSKTYFQGANK